jgi:hypothetical protein
MIIFGVLTCLVFVGVIALIPFGLRPGDRPRDVLLLRAEPRIAPRGATVTVTNPGQGPVVLGMSLRRAGLRLRLEGRSYCRVRTGSTTADLRADHQTSIAVIDRGETETFVVPADARIPRRAELVVVVGQPERLRTIHRLLVLPQPRDTGFLAGGGEARHQIGEAGLQPFER